MIQIRLLKEFADKWVVQRGGVLIHLFWRNGMLGQGRKVPAERMKWDNLTDEDILLDQEIARKFVEEFIQYYKSWLEYTHPETELKLAWNIISDLMVIQGRPLTDQTSDVVVARSRAREWLNRNYDDTH